MLFGSFDLKIFNLKITNNVSCKFVLNEQSWTDFNEQLNNDFTVIFFPA